LQQLETSVGDFAWSEFLTAAGLGDEEKFIVVDKNRNPSDRSFVQPDTNDNTSGMGGVYVAA